MGCSVFLLLNSELRAFDSRIVIILLFNRAAFFSLTFRLHICHSAKMSAINELNKDVARNKGKKTNQRNLFGFSNGFYFHLNKMTNNHIHNSSFRLFCTTMFVCVIRSKWFFSTRETCFGSTHRYTHFKNSFTRTPKSLSLSILL